MNNNIKEYWIFIDDSGNINLTDKESKFFIYSGLVFDNLSDIEYFRIGYKNNLIKNFSDFTKNEVKATDIMTDEQRKSIYNYIRNSKPILVSVTTNKEEVKKLKEIEEEFMNSIEPKRIRKKHRKNNYNMHKVHIIAQLLIKFICPKINSKEIKSIYKIKINIILDTDNLYFVRDCKNLEDYLINKHPFLKSYKNFIYNFNFEDSKKDYCLQGADFLANATLRVYNKANKINFLQFIQEKKIF